MCMSFTILAFQEYCCYNIITLSINIGYDWTKSYHIYLAYRHIHVENSTEIWPRKIKYTIFLALKINNDLKGKKTVSKISPTFHTKNENKPQITFIILGYIYICWFCWLTCTYIYMYNIHRSHSKVNMLIVCCIDLRWMHIHINDSLSVNSCKICQQKNRLG